MSAFIHIYAPFLYLFQLSLNDFFLNKKGTLILIILNLDGSLGPWVDVADIKLMPKVNMLL